MRSGKTARRGILRAAARLTIVVASLALAAPPALGASEPNTKNYQTRLDAIHPPVKGLSVTTQGGDKYLVVKNQTGKLVQVPGYDNEPYLRFLPNGQVQANANSPAKYLNAIRFGTPDTVTIPPSALAGTKVKWVVVGGNGSYKWFDHRIHWMEKTPPPIVKDKSKRTKIFDWKVPAKVGGTPVTLSGTLLWVPAAAGSSSGLSGGAIAAIVVGAIIVLAAVILLLRRRRLAPAGGVPPEKKAAEEAW
jgi:hypothetical protein